MRLEFSEQIFEKYSDIKFNDNLSNGNCVFFLCRQTDRTINKIFMSYTTINIKIHTIKCYKFLMATCFGHPCDHHQANFNRLCAFIGLTI